MEKRFTVCENCTLLKTAGAWRDEYFEEELDEMIRAEKELWFRDNAPLHETTFDTYAEAKAFYDEKKEHLDYRFGRDALATLEVDEMWILVEEYVEEYEEMEYVDYLTDYIRADVNWRNRI